MPIYEYRCTECDHRLEKLQRMADDPLKDCPECNQSALKKLVSAAAFKLKGSGWYETDFKNQDKSSGSKESSESKKNNTPADKAVTTKDSSSKTNGKSNAVTKPEKALKSSSSSSKE